MTEGRYFANMPLMHAEATYLIKGVSNMKGICLILFLF